MAVTRWIPLESNPEVLNRFASVIGLNVTSVTFCDVFGLDKELLAFLPGRPLAFLLLFPITDETEKEKAQEEERLSRVQQPGAQDVFFLRQTIGNACGTIALLHAVGNNLSNVDVALARPFAKKGLDVCSLVHLFEIMSPATYAPMHYVGSFLSRFYADTAALDPEARGRYLEDPPAEAPSIDDAHEEAAKDGQTEAPGADAKVNLHFITLLQRDNQLWELDGRKRFPVSHGASSPETFVDDAVKVMQSFMEKGAGALQFNIMALCALD